ncbi:MAG TPA: DUF1573 domain-containing protein [Bacteroidia bacterium]|jgi:hypothetical protein|nr:DUF1573 domain-containing protein [Bacteroidia bacterium]
MRFALTLTLFFLTGILSAQVLEIEHRDFLVDTIPFKFVPTSTAGVYDKVREIRIGCLNTGKTDLVFNTVQLGLKTDSSWINSSLNVRFPGSLKHGQYGEVVITWSTALSSFNRIKILSNAKNGDQVIRLRDTYVTPLQIIKDKKAFSYKVKEGENAVFEVILVNNGTAPAIIDSMVMPAPSLKLLSTLPLTLDPGAQEHVSLEGITKGMMNFYNGGSPTFYFHCKGSYEDFAQQAVSCVIIPNIVASESDTFSFGSVKRGTTVSHTFSFVNKGTVTLDATKANNTCAVFSKTSIGPGEKFTITVNYNTTLADSAAVNKEFPIQIAPFFYNYSLFLNGKVSGPSLDRSKILTPVESKKDLGVVYNDTLKTIRCDFKIKNTSNVPITVTSCTVNEKGAFVMCSNKGIIPAGQTFIVSFQYDPKLVGKFERMITVNYTTGDCTNGTFFLHLDVSGEVKHKGS